MSGRYLQSVKLVPSTLRGSPAIGIEMVRAFANTWAQALPATSKGPSPTERPGPRSTPGRL